MEMDMVTWWLKANGFLDTPCTKRSGASLYETIRDVGCWILRFLTDYILLVGCGNFYEMLGVHKVDARDQSKAEELAGGVRS